MRHKRGYLARREAWQSALLMGAALSILFSLNCLAAYFILGALRAH